MAAMPKSSTIPPRIARLGGVILSVVALAWEAVPARAATPAAPDLSGSWDGSPSGAKMGSVFGDVTEGPNGDVVIAFAGRDGDFFKRGYDNYVRDRQTQNLPQYKSEFWAKVQQLDRERDSEDPLFKCLPAGAPRMGPPVKIVQLADEIILFYGGDTNTNPGAYRVIPITGSAEHTTEELLEGTWMGDSVARWDGATLVIDSSNFTDQSWFGGAGYFHSAGLRLVERLTRVGNSLVWEATVEDPEMLTAPYKAPPRTSWLNRTPRPPLAESPPCVLEGG